MALIMGSPGMLTTRFRASREFPWSLVGLVVFSSLVLASGISLGAATDLPASARSEPTSAVLGVMLLGLLAIAGTIGLMIFETMLVTWPKMLSTDDSRIVGSALAVVAANSVIAFRNLLLGVVSAFSLVTMDKVIFFVTSPFEPFGLYSIFVFFAVYRLNTGSLLHQRMVRLMATATFGLVTVGAAVALPKLVLG